MKHPLLNVTPWRRLPVFLLFLGLTFLSMLALNVSGRSLTTDDAPSGIISYEFAGDVATADQIIDSWDEQTRIAAGFNVGFDYLYLFLYSTTIAMAILWLTDRSAWPGWIVTLGVVLAWGQWLAAGLDAVENYSLLRMLLNGPTAPWPRVAYWCAAFKFGLVAAGLLYVIIALVARLVGRARQCN